MITSYAQNFEDVMLWRALRHVENGFYIDVGAQHPLIDSVSLAFYEHGWRGIHVEPNSHYAQLLRESRLDEKVIQAAVGERGAVLKFYEIADTGLSTCDAEIAERHRASAFAVREVSVPCVTLANIFEACAGREIHWLKIDVEGSEEQVLQGWQPSKARPWVVVVESTVPSTQIESHEKWEKLIIDLDYEFVYFDGLNRFYLAKKHSELKDALRVGPNVYDSFVLSGTSSATFCSLLKNRLASREQALGAHVAQGQEEIQRLSQTLASREQALGAHVAQGQEEIQRLSQALAEANAWGQCALARISSLEYELSKVYQSKSWRITLPLRVVSYRLRRLSDVSKAFVRRLANKMVNSFRSVAPGIFISLKRIVLLRRIYMFLTRADARSIVPNIHSPQPVTIPQPEPIIEHSSRSTQLNLHRVVQAWRLGRRVDE